MKNEKIAVVGAGGKMGSLVSRRLQEHFDVVEIFRGESLDKAKGVCLMIDFASAESSVCCAKWCKEQKVPLIIGSTGQSKLQLFEIYKCANVIPILVSGNFSAGILQVKKLIDKIDFGQVVKISILEKHHKNKKDKPSGTALELEKIIRSKTAQEIEIVSTRENVVVGEHEIDFHLKNELISITHQAYSRECFVDGVVDSVRFLKNVNEVGIFSFCDVF